MKRWLQAADFHAMPWANGKGVTLELARADAGGAMLWRLSRASVVQEGPFSIFPEVERNLTVLNGPGFDLTGAGTVLQARPWVPVAFAGDVALRATAVRAPSEDFNVMTARHLGRAGVRVLAGAEVLRPKGLMAVYWPEAARLLITDESCAYAGDGPAIVVHLPPESGGAAPGGRGSQGHGQA